MRSKNTDMFREGDEVKWLRGSQWASGVIQRINITDKGMRNQYAQVAITGSGIAFPLMSDLQHVSGVVALSRAASYT